MSDDLTQSLQPVIVPASIDDFGFRISSTRESIDNSNQAPTSITLDASSAIENDVGGHIANINGVDPDGNSLTYSVISDPGGMIEVDGSTVKFREGVSADYEQYQSLHFSLRATDPDGLYKDQDFNLNVLDDTSDNNHAPTSITLDASSVTENDVGGHIANISGNDPDGDTLTYSVIVTNQESMMVEVTGTTIHFKDEWSADYEQDQSLDFILRATDPDRLYVDQEFNLNVLDDVSDNSDPLTVGWEITDTNDLRWFDVASSVDIILNQSDYPVGKPQFDGYGNLQVMHRMNLVSKRCQCHTIIEW